MFHTFLAAMNIEKTVENNDKLPPVKIFIYSYFKKIY